MPTLIVCSINILCVCTHVSICRDHLSLSIFLWQLVGGSAYKCQFTILWRTHYSDMLRHIYEHHATYALQCILSLPNTLGRLEFCSWVSCNGLGATFWCALFEVLWLHFSFRMDDERIIATVRTFSCLHECMWFFPCCLLHTHNIYIYISKPLLFRYNLSRSTTSSLST